MIIYIAFPLPCIFLMSATIGYFGLWVRRFLRVGCLGLIRAFLPPFLCNFIISGTDLLYFLIFSSKSEKSHFYSYFYSYSYSDYLFSSSFSQIIYPLWPHKIASYIIKDNQTITDWSKPDLLIPILLFA